MNKIDTLAQLRVERLRLKQKQANLEKEIVSSFNDIKNSFSPSNLVTNGAASMLVNKNHGVVNKLLSLTTDFILKNTILRNAGFIIRLVVPLITRNTANNLLETNKTKILGWLGEQILKMGSKKKNSHKYDRTTANMDY